MKDHKVIVSKTTKMKPLFEDPFLSRHLPQTKPFDQYHLEHMLDTYSTLYIKPDKGKLGNEVFRLRRIDDQQIDLSSGQSTESFPLEEAFSRLNRRLNASKRYNQYIIQQGIDLATFQGCPFDFRIVMVKPADRWCLGPMSAKVARSKDAVVTNVAKGADEMWIDHVLRDNDQKLNATDVLWELIDVSHQIAQVLGSHFPFRIIGLDMAIDKKGHVWFIEANTDPVLKGMDRINKSLWERYKELLKI